MKPSSTTRKVSIAERLYSLLLAFYPAEFRRVYRQEMVQTFRDCYRDALREHGSWWPIHMWGLLLYDLTTTIIVEHARNIINHLFGNTSDIAMTTEGSMMFMKHFNISVAQRTDIGRKREVNEDTMLSVIPEDQQVKSKKGALFVVADGLGGHAAGAVASGLAVNAIREAYYQDEDVEIAESLRNAVKRANTEVYRQATGRTELNTMGTTCVAAVLQGEMVYLANVGDSRAYIVRGGEMKQLTQDHSWVAEQVRIGALTLEEARTHENRNQIYRCLGTSADVEVDVFTEQVQENDVLLLCTDGLSNMVSDEELRTVVQQSGPEESVYRLIERANEEGGLDNITVMVARVASEQSEVLAPAK